MAHTHVRDSNIVFTVPLNGVMTKLSIPGRIFSTTKSDRNKGKSLQQFCPEDDCHSPIGHQLYCKYADHGPFQRNEVLRGRITEIDGEEKVVIVDEPEEVVESDLARGKLTLTMVDRESLANETSPQGNTYHFMPTPADTDDMQAYTILHSAITDNPDWAFVCRANIGRGAETLISVEAGAFGGLTLQSLAYPEMLYDLPETELPDLSDSDRKAIRLMLEDQVQEFDPDDWHDRQAEAISDAVTVASTRKGKPPKVKKPAKTESSLMEAIRAAADRKEAS